MKVMGTGSRSLVKVANRLEIYQNLEQKIFQIADKHGDIVLISGMAEGWDEAIAKIGMRNEIPYVCCLPNAGYRDYYWAAPRPREPKSGSLLGYDRRSTFDELIAHAADIIVVCDTLFVNGVHSNYVRNQFMVDMCDIALVYSTGSSGTRDAVARLNVAKKPFMVAPFNLQEEFVF